MRVPDVWLEKLRVSFDSVLLRPPLDGIELPSASLLPPAYKEMSVTVI